MRIETRKHGNRICVYRENKILFENKEGMCILAAVLHLPKLQLILSPVLLQPRTSAVKHTPYGQLYYLIYASNSYAYEISNYCMHILCF